MDALVPIPAGGRTFSSRCSIRLSDMDARGRLRLDAVARYLQDVASFMTPEEAREYGIIDRVITHH